VTRESKPFVLVVSLQPLDATTTLFFGHLQRRMPDAIRVVQYGSAEVVASLSEAAAVVLVRGLFELGDVARCARALRIPLYYFLDDNFIVLREQGGTGAEFVTRYLVGDVRAALRDFAGVLLATPALVSYFADEGLHSRLFLFPPVMGDSALAMPRADRPGLTVAFFGGRHLHRQLLDVIVPAIRRLARQRPVRLLAAGLLESIPASEGLVVSQRPYDASYSRGLHALATEEVDVLVHPVAAGMVNNAYKNPHALISALALGAIPIVSNTPPYDALVPDGVALTNEDHEASWLNSLTLAATDHTLRSTLLTRLAAYCAEQFSGSPNRAIVEMMLAGHAPRGWAQTQWRRGIVRGHHALNLAGRVALRITKAARQRAVTDGGMSGIGGTQGSVWVERIPTISGPDLWVVSEGGHDVLQGAEVKEGLAFAQRTFDARAEVASISFVVAGPATAQPGAAAFRLWAINGRVTDLVGLDNGRDKTSCANPVLQRWLETATLRGLRHEEIAAGHSCGALAPEQVAADAPPLSKAISVGIDAAWLVGSESGAQVAAVELIRELVRRPEIARVVLLSDTGVVPDRLAMPKVSGMTWASALAIGTPIVDIVHRPYQPGADVDFRRYLRVGTSVALTVLDLIAYDNPAYHESAWWRRRYQDAFAEQVCLADCVFAISGHVGSRLQQLFGDRLSGPVRPALLGTDHLNGDIPSAPDLGPALKPLDGARFLLVLGNDFIHKNRDFAVKVFADMCDRGYDGGLVLAGFHLDRWSSFDYELSGAGRYADRITRLGSMSNSEKIWLLQNAHAVLYTTSAEGFGLVPFEAAARGTPAAFVRFGPMRETLPDVDACDGWQVRPFADYVFRLLANPQQQVAAIQAAGATLTWTSHADHVLAAYRHMLSPGASWRTRGRVLPTWQTRWRRSADLLSHRVGNKLRRLAGRNS
jgi:glycosyltransferase involved in cell wall biosynthesis